MWRQRLLSLHWVLHCVIRGSNQLGILSLPQKVNFLWCVAVCQLWLCSTCLCRLCSVYQGVWFSYIPRSRTLSGNQLFFLKNSSLFCNTGEWTFQVWNIISLCPWHNQWLAFPKSMFETHPYFKTSCRWCVVGLCSPGLERLRKWEHLLCWVLWESPTP